MLIYPVVLTQNRLPYTDFHYPWLMTRPDICEEYTLLRGPRKDLPTYLGLRGLLDLMILDVILVLCSNRIRLHIKPQLHNQVDWLIVMRFIM